MKPATASPAAERFLPDLERLADAMGRPDWITEEVDAHLLPHIVRHAESTHSPWRVDASELVDARLVVDLWWERDERDPQPLQADTLALLGAFVEYDIATGMLDGDRVFATHGHLVTLRIRGPRGTPNA